MISVHRSLGRPRGSKLNLVNTLKSEDFVIDTKYVHPKKTNYFGELYLTFWGELNLFLFEKNTRDVVSKITLATGIQQDRIENTEYRSFRLTEEWLRNKIV
jgi:hypothetical protein